MFGCESKSFTSLRQLIQKVMTRVHEIPHRTRAWLCLHWTLLSIHEIFLRIIFKSCAVSWRTKVWESVQVQEKFWTALIKFTQPGFFGDVKRPASFQLSRFGSFHLFSRFSKVAESASKFQDENIFTSHLDFFQTLIQLQTSVSWL